jgi:hypothetical protein
MRKPAGIVAAVLCMYGLEQWAQATNPLFNTYGTFVNLATGLLVVAALTMKFLRNDLHITQYPTGGLACLALYGLAVASIFWCSYRDGWIERMDLMWPYIVTVVMLMPLLVYDIRDLRTGMFYMLGIGGVLAVLLALTVQWSYRGIELQGSVGERGNPLAVASMGGYVCIIAALLNFRGIARVWQIMRWPVLGFGLYLPIVSGSRGQLLALLPTIALLLPLSRRISNWKGLLATFFALGVFGAVALVGYTYFATDARWEGTEMLSTYGDTRLFSVKLVLTEWLQSGPIAWVIGMGNSAAFDPTLLGKHPHFMAVEILTEEGLVGFILLGIVLWLTARSVYRIYPYVKNDPDMRGVLAAAAGIFLYEMILSCKQGSLLFNTYVFAFAIILGRVELFFTRNAPSIAYSDPVTTRTHA